MCSVFGQDAREASSYECILFASQAANSLVKNMPRGAAPALATYPRVPGWVTARFEPSRLFASRGQTAAIGPGATTRFTSAMRKPSGRVVSLRDRLCSAHDHFTDAVMLRHFITPSAIVLVRFDICRDFVMHLNRSTYLDKPKQLII